MTLIPLDCHHSTDWLKTKNPACAAVKREAESTGDGEARPLSLYEFWSGFGGDRTRAIVWPPRP